MKKCNVPKLAATKHGSNMWVAKQGVQKKEINFKQSKIFVNKISGKEREANQKHTQTKTKDQKNITLKNKNTKYSMKKSGKKREANQSTHKQKPKIKHITLKTKTKIFFKKNLSGGKPKYTQTKTKNKKI